MLNETIRSIDKIFINRNSSQKVLREHLIFTLNRNSFNFLFHHFILYSQYAIKNERNEKQLSIIQKSFILVKRRRKRYSVAK